MVHCLCYVELICFGYSKFSSVTTKLVELGLPSFNTVLHNAAASFNHSRHTWLSENGVDLWCQFLERVS